MYVARVVQGNIVVHNAHIQRLSQHVSILRTVIKAFAVPVSQATIKHQKSTVIVDMTYSECKWFLAKCLNSDSNCRYITNIPQQYTPHLAHGMGNMHKIS